MEKMQLLQISKDMVIEQLESEIIYLKSEVFRLEGLICIQKELILELQCKADPYSEDGTPICNS